MIDTAGLYPLVVIIGPTAVGKSKVGVLAAKMLDGEIVSADSMLIYRGLDIGTAKPKRTEMCGIPHHMIDLIEPDQEYSVALYQAQARNVIADIHRRKKLPILVGGSGLYIDSVIKNYSFSGTGRNKPLRELLSAEVFKTGTAGLYKKLSEIDPDAAAKIRPGDARRIIRALEVYSLTGMPISRHHNRDEERNQYALLIFGLCMDRKKLYRTIEQRVEAMLRDGLVDEVRRLLQKGYNTDLNSMRGLGYKEIASYLKGETTFDEAVEILKKNTRRFAKRQMTWFRRYSKIKWFDIDKCGGHEAVAQEISRHVEGVFQGL